MVVLNVWSENKRQRRVFIVRIGDGLESDGGREDVHGVSLTTAGNEDGGRRLSDAVRLCQPGRTSYPRHPVDDRPRAAGARRRSSPGGSKSPGDGGGGVSALSLIHI